MGRQASYGSGCGGLLSPVESQIPVRSFVAAVVDSVVVVSQKPKKKRKGKRSSGSLDFPECEGGF